MYYYIVNPAAGGSKIDKIQDRLKSRLRDLGIMGEFVKSTGPEDIAKLTKMAIDKGYKTIVAVGGDGTINEVMNELIDQSKIVLGIIPIGATNDLADSLGIHGWFSATGILASRKIEEINLGKIGDRYFVTSATLGFDAEFSKDKRLVHGNALDKFRFWLQLFSKSASFKPVNVKLTFDNSYEVEAEVFSVIVSNTKFLPVKKYTRNLTDDSLLDTVVITKIPGYKMLNYGRTSDGSAIELPKISVFHSREVTIETRKPREVAADGQVVTQTPAKIRLSEKNIRVYVSRRRKF
jgi:YegS/Rv2252/BmrU family lipid kinase